MNSLLYYQRLTAAVDDFTAGVMERYGRQIQCRRGCSECCILESVHPVEAWMLKNALEDLPEKTRSGIVKRVFKSRRADDRCILLWRGACLVYEHRPVICRTHGFPLLVEEEIDRCPMNLAGLEEIEPSCVLNLENLDTRLAAINMRFVEEVEDAFFKKTRISLRDLVRHMVIEKGNG